MPQWISLAVLSAFFAALVPILGKRGLVGIDVTTATTLRALVMAAMLSALAVFRFGWRFNATIEASSTVWIALSGLAGALSWLCYFSALDQGPATSVVAIDRASVIFAVLLAAVFLAEELTIRSISGAFLVTIGATLIAWK